jgi:thymidylate synthase
VRNMKQYLDALKFIMENGVVKPNRTGTDTKAVFGMQMRYDLSEGFPIITTKKMAFESIKAELLWFISGSSDVKELNKLGCHIWDANAKADYWKPKAKFDGDLGRIYGVQWRNWMSYGSEKPIDQLSEVIDRIKKNPYDRRLVVTAWNPGELNKMALPPCHLFFQFYIADGKLSVQMYQRSCDMFLGVPFNISSYSLFLSMIAQITGLKPGEFIHTLGDAHIYVNHFEQVKTQLSREPFPLPQLWLNPEIKNIDDFKMEDIKLTNYQYHEPIKAPMAI